MTHELDLRDPNFLGDLRASRESVDMLARWLRNEGHPVVQYPERERPTAAERAAYADTCDFSVLANAELKRRRFNFTSIDSYPFDTVLLDTVDRYKRKPLEPWVYFIGSCDMRTVLVFYVQETKHAWAIENKFVPAVGMAHDYYSVPKRLAQVFHTDPDSVPPQPTLLPEGAA